jgi:hypothetical protein
MWMIRMCPLTPALSPSGEGEEAVALSVNAGEYLSVLSPLGERDRVRGDLAW